MPRYQVTLDGKTFIVEGDRPPTEDEARQAFAAYQPPQEQAAPAAEEKTVGGFLGNVLSSGGRFVSDAVQGGVGLAKLAGKGALAASNPGGPQAQELAQGALGLVRNAPKIASAVKEGVANRYGGIEQIKDTLYNDPVGVLGDVSAVASLGAGVAPKASRIGRVLSAVESGANPVRLAQPIAKATEYGVAAAVRPMLKPNKGLRRQQDGVLEIERTALKEGAFTAERAGAKTKQSAKRASEIADAAGTSVPRERITQMPGSLEKVERGVGHKPDLDQLAKLESEVADSLPSTLTPRELLDKRRYLDRQLNDAFRAADRGGAPTGIRQSGQKEIVGNIRAALRESAPNIRAADDKTRRLAMVGSALEDAGLRAGDIPMGAALMGAGTAAAGLPGAGLVGSGFALGRTFPQIPLALGSVPVRGTAAAAKAAADPFARQSLLLSALLERLAEDR